MKNKYDFNNIKTVRMSCNEWCCPANEGRGCQAPEAFSIMCDNNSKKFSDLLNEAYDVTFNDEDTYNEVAYKLYELMEDYK